MKYSEPFIEIEFQEGGRHEVGENGCQLSEVVDLCVRELNRLDDNYTCRENALVRTKLQEALHWLEHRTRDRVSRGVEGFAKP